MPIRTMVVPSSRQSATILSKSLTSESPGLPSGVSRVADSAATSIPSSDLARSISATSSLAMEIWESSTAWKPMSLSRFSVAKAPSSANCVLSIIACTPIFVMSYALSVRLLSAG